MPSALLPSRYIVNPVHPFYFKGDVVLLLDEGQVSPDVFDFGEGDEFYVGDGWQCLLFVGAVCCMLTNRHPELIWNSLSAFGEINVVAALLAETCFVGTSIIVLHA